MSSLPTTPSLAGPALGGARALTRGAIALGLALLLGVAIGPARADEEGELPGTRPSQPRASIPSWSDESLDLASRIAIQDGGRVKPLSTWARFTLMRFSKKTSVKLDDDTKRSTMEWLLDTLFYPDLASDYPVLLVEDSQVLEDVGLSAAAKRKRDRYSYNEILPGVQALILQANQYERLEPKDRTSRQQQVVDLAMNFERLHNLLLSFTFARIGVPVGTSAEATELFPDRERVRFDTLLARQPLLLERAAAETGGTGASGPVSTLLDEALDILRYADVLPILPPTGDREAEPAWYTVRELLAWPRTATSDRSGAVAGEHVALVTLLHELALSRDDPRAFDAALRSLQTKTEALAEARGEYRSIGLEVTFYRMNPFLWSLILFLVAFTLTAISWIRSTRWLERSIWGLLSVATALTIVGIVMRCIIRERPPVSTLYETVLFITAMGVLVALGIEWINRKRIALVMASVLGGGGLFLAYGLEFLQREDTMPKLQAVLDTNFWLSTHVTTVTWGYSAGLLAALLAHVYVLGKAFGLKQGDHAFYATLTRMTYGIICFGLLLSTVGTILGGIWANESWGRFWGWDPKENGALMIVLWNLVILHGRMGGYLRGFGIAMAAIFGGCIVAFSWWGVNLLGIGLHTYGFASGILTALLWFYAVEGAVLLTGLYWWQVQGRHGQTPATGS